MMMVWQIQKKVVQIQKKYILTKPYPQNKGTIKQMKTGGRLGRREGALENKRACARLQPHQARRRDGDQSSVLSRMTHRLAPISYERN